MMRRITETLSLIIKLLVIIAIIAVGILVYQSCAGGHIVQRIDKMVPDELKAPFVVTTMTHLYYAGQATVNNDKSITISNWYEQSKGKWVLHKETVTLPVVLHPALSKR